mgnify:CR=1 FL=1
MYRRVTCGPAVSIERPIMGSTIEVATIPAPPMMEGDIGPDFRRAGMRLEHEGSWRGMFLCSAGVIEARLPD